MLKSPSSKCRVRIQTPECVLLSTKYSGPLNNMGLNCVCPLIRGFFSINTHYALQDPQLVESMDAEPRIQRADCKVILGISTAEESVPQPLSCSSVNYTVSS